MIDALPTSDGFFPTADDTTTTIDADGSGRYPAGWPCAALGDDPPSVADRQSAPSADDLLPQVLALKPRGPAWGTDEAGDGSGASPLQRLWWKALAAWSAANNALDWTLSTQVFPSAIDPGLTLDDWEAELGLPDSCFVGGGGVAARIGAVRARFGGRGGASPAYFVCLAAAIGYTITIEEPTQFMVDVSEVGEDSLIETWSRVDEGEVDGTPIEGFVLTAGTEALDEAGLDPFVDTAFRVDEGLIDETPIEGFAPTPGGNVWQDWIVHVSSFGETWFRVDEGMIDTDPIEGFATAADLECLIRRLAPEHTAVHFAYSLPA